MKQIAIGIFAILLLGAVFVGIIAYIRKNADRRIARYQNDLIEKHFEEVDNMYRQTRGWRHDFKNHVQTMQAYLEMGELERLRRYLCDLAEDFDTVDTVLKTGNIMLDAILNSKISILRNKDIRVDATATVSGEIPISDVDLSVIIGNLLDNAMEACMKVPLQERFVRLYIDKVKDNLYIYIMNSADGTYSRGQEGYLSTKAVNGHGFGLQRIDKVVKKYKGYRNRQDEGNVFATEILLPLHGK